MTADPDRPTPQQPDDDEHPDPGDVERAYRRDEREAGDALEAARRSRVYGRALWGYRLYYIGFFTALGTLIVGCLGVPTEPLTVIAVALPVGLIGHVFGLIQLRKPFNEYLEAANPQLPQARRERRQRWQVTIFKDAFMGRPR